MYDLSHPFILFSSIDDTDTIYYVSSCFSFDIDGTYMIHHIPSFSSSSWSRFPYLSLVYFFNPQLYFDLGFEPWVLHYFEPTLRVILLSCLYPCVLLEFVPRSPFVCLFFLSLMVQLSLDFNTNFLTTFVDHFRGTGAHLVTLVAETFSLFHLF